MKSTSHSNKHEFQVAKGKYAQLNTNVIKGFVAKNENKFDAALKLEGQKLVLDFANQLLTNKATLCIKEYLLSKK